MLLTLWFVKTGAWCADKFGDDQADIAADLGAQAAAGYSSRLVLVLFLSVVSLHFFFVCGCSPLDGGARNCAPSRCLNRVVGQTFVESRHLRATMSGRLVHIVFGLVVCNEVDVPAWFSGLGRVVWFLSKLRWPVMSLMWELEDSFVELFIMCDVFTKGRLCVERPLVCLHLARQWSSPRVSVLVA